LFMSIKVAPRLNCLFLIFLSLLALLFGSSCVSGPAAQDIPAGTELLFSPLPDPLEGYNRSVELFNQNLVEHLVFPVSQAYNFVLPEPAREGIHNAGVNLFYPLRLVNCLLQCKFEAAWQESQRFAVNSTVGLLGLRDQASRWGMPLHREDFGQSLAYYNCPAGFYFNLPFLGPSNLRDCAGMLLAIPCSLQYWLLSEPLAMSCDALIMGNESAAAAYTLDNYFKTQYDSYLLSRAMYNAQRKALASDYQIAPDCESNPDQSLGYLLLRPQDPEFASRGYERRLRLPGAKSRLPYSCWPSPGSAKTLIILPGLGGHRLSAGVLALAELLQAQGYSVLALSSSLNPDYFRHLPEAAPPGFFWADRRQQALALGACVEDMQRHFKLPEQVCTVLGYSLGAINALYLSDLEFKEGLPGGLQVRRYLAINPPADPPLALSKIDDYFAIPQSWPAEQRQRRSEELMLKLVTALKDFNGQNRLPLSLEESQFLIALNMRLNLAETIAAAQKQNNQGFLRHDPAAFQKNALWLELMNLSFDDYMRLSVMPYYREKLDCEPDWLLEKSRLSALEGSLRRNDKLRLLQNRNDFLIDSEQLSWYSRVFGRRALLLPEGGHLGNMYHPDYQALIVKMLEEDDGGGQ